MHRKFRLTACLVAALTLGSTTLYAGADAGSVAAARELYAAAAYDDALKMLDELLAGAPPFEERRSIALYRILCLVALDRSADVNNAMEALIIQEPLYRPTAAELSPRMQASFNTARKRLLPQLIQLHYNEAKAVYDRGDFMAAVLKFKQVLDELADPDIADLAKASPLSDLRTLAGGFHDLSVKNVAPPPVAAAPRPAAPTPPAAPVRDFLRIYSTDDSFVVPPVVVRQQVPPFNGRLTSQLSGIVEIVVSATGAVESAVMRMNIHPQYDEVILAAAQRWQYRPATLDGVPVKYVRRVQITLSPPAN